MKDFLSKRFTTNHLYRPVLDDSLVLWLRGNISGNNKMFDLSKKANHGIISGATWTNTPLNRPCLNFDGADDYVVVAEGNDASIDLTTAVTYMCWVKPDNGGDTYGRFMSKTSASPYGSRVAMLGKELDDETNVRWETAGTLPDTVLNSGTNKMIGGVWNHVAGTYVSGTKKIYVNGVNVASDSSTGSITSTLNGALWLGCIFTSNQNFLGNLDDIRIYNRALSNKEVEQIFHLTRHEYGV